MGGYAALLFGALTNTKARAFGPQTTLEDVPWDQRWASEWEKIRLETKHPEYLDLKDLNQHPETTAYYCVGSGPEDFIQATRLNIKVVIRPCHNHKDSARELPIETIFR